MSEPRLRRPVSAAIPFAANATNWVPHSKTLLLATFAALLFLGAFAVLHVVVTAPSRADMPPVLANRTLKCYDGTGKYEPCVTLLSRAHIAPKPANSTLRCYDSAGQYEPCVTRATASQSRFSGPTTGADQLASWTITALYPVDQPANWTASAPAAWRSGTSERRPARAVCRRRLVPCFFSALQKGLAHIASVAATVGETRPARERL